MNSDIKGYDEDSKSDLHFELDNNSNEDEELDVEVGVHEVLAI